MDAVVVLETVEEVLGADQQETSILANLQSILKEIECFLIFPLVQHPGVRLLLQIAHQHQPLLYLISTEPSVSYLLRRDTVTAKVPRCLAWPQRLAVPGGVSGEHKSSCTPSPVKRNSLTCTLTGS